MPRSVAIAVIKGDFPEVYVADGIATLNWVIALKVIARLSKADLGEGIRDQLQQALLDERWGDAVELWIDKVDGDGIDVYESYELFTGNDVASAAHEMQFLPLFEE